MSNQRYHQAPSTRRIHTETQSEEEEEFRRALDSIPPPTPLDGGWGWMVVFASFMINAIVDGVCYSFGIMIPEFVYHFHKNYTDLRVDALTLFKLQQHVLKLTASTNDDDFKYPVTVISLGGALLLGVYMLSGPMAGALCNRFGSRRVAMGGCMMSFISLFFTQYAHTTPVFLLLFGLCAGLGFGLMFLASIVIVGFYFERRRSLASTIAMCGSGVGMAAIAPLVTHLFDEFEWKGALVLLSGVVLHGMVLATLYRPLDADLRRRKKLILRRLEEDKRIGPQTCVIMQRLLEEKKRQRTVSTGSMNNVIITRENVLLRYEEEHQEFRERKPSIINRLKSALGKSKDNLGVAGGSRASSAQSSRAGTPQVAHRPIPNIKVNGVDTPPSAGSPFAGRHLNFTPTPSNLVQDSGGGGSNQGSVRSLQIGKTSPLHGDPPERAYHSVSDFPAADNISLAMSVGGASAASTSTAPENAEELLKIYKNHTPDTDRPMYRKDILYSGSVRNLPQYNNNIDDYIASITQVPQEPTAGAVEDDHGCCWHRLGCLPKSIRDVLRSILDTSTFSSPTYILLLIASTFTMLGYFVPFVFLPVYARSVGVEAADVALLLSIIGASNTAGRIVAGVLGGRKWVDALVINNVALVLAGAAVIALPWFNEHYLLITFSVVFGLCVAAFSSLRSQIVVELMGLDKLTTAFSQLTVIQGIAVIIGTPIAGVLFDVTQNFDYGFYVAGTSILFSGFLCFPLRSLSNRERRRTGRLTPSTNSSQDEVKKAILPASQGSEILPLESSAESPL